MTPKWKVACVTTHPIQYQAPLFRYLASDPSLDLKVFFLSDISARRYRDPGFRADVEWDVSLLGGYAGEFIPALGRRDRLSALRPLSYGFSKALREGHFDALWVHGYAHQGLLRAIAAAKRARIPVLMRGESNLNSGSARGVVRNLKDGFMRVLVGSVDAFLAIGSLNREYWMHYGAPRDRIFAMPYAVDNAFFRARRETARKSRDKLRFELGLTAAQRVILFAAKLQRRKRAVDLLAAFARLVSDLRDSSRYCLVFVGEGEERAALEDFARRGGLDRVRFRGFVKQTEMPRYYDLADVFVLPSEREPWGLVVNEAMNFSKPVVASVDVGAAADLVEHGRSGFVYPVGDTGALSSWLRAVLENEGLRTAMGNRAFDLVSKFDFEADRRGLLSALARVSPCRES